MRRAARGVCQESVMACFDVLRRGAYGHIVVELAMLLADAIDESKVMAVLNRLVRKGIVKKLGRGKQAEYELVRRADDLDPVRAKKERSSRPWDGSWSVLAYDVRTTNNALRRHLARLLHRLGFARLSASAWVSPYYWLDFLRPTLARWERCGVFTYIHSAEVVPAVGGSEECSARLWDLSDIADRYERVIKLCKASAGAGRRKGLQTRMQAYAAAARQLASIENDDPMLPADLLAPKVWPRARALREVDRLLKGIQEDVASAPTASAGRAS